MKHYNNVATRLGYKRIWVGVVALSLVACATPPPGPAVPVDVQIPVAVPCNAPHVDRPAFAVDALPLDADVWTQMAALRAERHQRKAYELQLEAAIKACQ